jgi:hypothetical protein
MNLFKIDSICNLNLAMLHTKSETVFLIIVIISLICIYSNITFWNYRTSNLLKVHLECCILLLVSNWICCWLFVTVLEPCMACVLCKLAGMYAVRMHHYLSWSLLCVVIFIVQCWWHDLSWLLIVKFELHMHNSSWYEWSFFAFWFRMCNYAIIL